MSTQFPLSYIAQIDRAVQKGRGAAASVVGQEYDVYRLTSTTQNSIISGTPLYTNFPAKPRRNAKRVAVENTIFELLVFDFTCDNTYLEVGDVLVESGYGSDGGIFAVAQKRPLMPCICVRAENSVSVSRPATLGGSAASQPASGSVFNPNYAGTYKKIEEVLTLTNGDYNFASSGNVASVPFGLQPQNRPRSEHKPDFPTQVVTTRFVGYIPLMPGVQFLENDIVNSANGDRYMCIQPYFSPSGLQGWISLFEKMGV